MVNAGDPLIDAQQEFIVDLRIVVKEVNTPLIKGNKRTDLFDRVDTEAVGVVDAAALHQNLDHPLPRDLRSHHTALPAPFSLHGIKLFQLPLRFVYLSSYLS